MTWDNVTTPTSTIRDEINNILRTDYTCAHVRGRHCYLQSPPCWLRSCLTSHRLLSYFVVLRDFIRRTNFTTLAITFISWRLRHRHASALGWILKLVQPYFKVTLPSAHCSMGRTLLMLVIVIADKIAPQFCQSQILCRISGIFPARRPLSCITPWWRKRSSFGFVRKSSKLVHNL